MTQSTFSAQVANNLLTLLHGYSKTIRLLLVMFLTLTVSAEVWAEEATLSFASTAQRVSQNTTKQVWSNGGITFTNNKASSTNNVANYSNPVRLYASSEVIVEHTSGKMTKIVFDCNSNAYASTMKTSIGTVSGTTVTVSSDKVTVNFTSAVASFTVAKLSGQIRLDAITVTYTSGGSVTPDPCTTPTVAWNTKPANGEVGGSMTASVTTNYSNGLTYSSSNQTVATVTNAGFINYLSAGTTTITATVTGDGTTFCEGPVSVQQEITVTAPAGGGGGDGECSWTLVADASTLKVDDEVIITASGSTTDNNYALSTNQKSNNRAGAAITKNGNTLTAPSADVQILTLKAGSTSGTFAFYTGTSGYLYAASSSANQLKTKATLDAHGSWTISITDGVASIVAEGSSNRNVMQYNYNNGSPLFACYASASQTSLAIYKKICSDDGGDEPTPTKLDKPTNLKVSDVNTTTATLSWDAVANANGYTVVVGSTSHNTNTTSITVENLTASTTYKWSVTAKGNGSTYTDSDAANGSDFTTKTTAPKTYTITFEANGGRKMDPMTEQTALPNPLPETERDHYTFVGWYMDETLQTQATAGAPINANTTLYAKWTPITYTVTFDAGSGTCATEPTQGNFVAGITLPTATPCTYAQENGWRFVGWSETTVSETTVRPAIHTGNYKPTKNIILHAVYAKTGTAQGAAGEFILSLEYKGTTYYVGQTFDNNKLSAEAEQTNAARFTIEDNYLHYEGGYISHVSTSGSTNITRQANKEDAEVWTIADNGSTITFTSTADETRGLGFNYNDGSPRFAAYKLNEKDGETIKYPSTFTKTSVSGGNIQVTTYNSNPSCVAPVIPTWQPATINFDGIIQVECGSKTLLNAADPKGPATITFNGYDLQNPVTVTASNGFLISTNETVENTYKQEVTVNPHKDGQNIGKIQNVYVIAQAPAQSGDYTGTITLTGEDITNGSQVINVTAAVTCTQYTITWSVNGDTELIAPTTFYAGGKWELPENPTYECNGREFVGWTNTEIVQPQDIAPNVLYKEQGDFPTIESDITFYAVFAQEGTGDGSGTATVTDVLNRTTTGISNGAGYGNWSGKTAESSAVYAGRSAGGNDAIQLRITDSNEGIITTTSGGKARKVTVVWNTSTTSGRVLNIYGKNSAYSAVTELYGNNAGTLIGNIKYGTSTELIISDDYEYIGIRSNSGAMYLTSISIQWETDGEGDGNATTYTSYTTSCADVTAIRIVEPTTKTFNEGDKFVFDGQVLAINSDDSETDVTNSPLVHFDVDMNKVGTQTVTVSYLGFTASYEITINAVDKWQITWNVSGATSTGLSPATVVKGQAIGKLPNPKAIPDGCDGKTFVGWTESNTVNSDGTEITFITSSTVPTQNTTYYAVFATPSGNAGDGDYVKLTETPANLSGEYLIVYEAGSLAFNGGLTTLDAENNTIDVTIDGNTIESTSTTDAAKFTITKNGDAYIITSARNYHIGQTSDANGLLSSTSTSYTNTITITDGNADIIGSGKAHLRYNSASNQNRFRYYKSTTYTSQQPIALYKKSGSSASYTDYTTGCHDVTITYYGFTGGYTTNCGGSDLNVITQRVNSSHTIPTCTEITDPTTLGRTFLNLWKDQNGKVHQPGESFIVTQDITLYAQWALNTSEENTTLPTDVEDLATTDVVVTGGTTLTLQAGTTTINSLTLKGGLQSNGSYAMPIINVPNNSTLVRKDSKINLDLTVNNQSYYPFAVPFEVQNIKANIHYLDEYLNSAATYGTHYQVLTYDGALRAENGLSDDNWVEVGRHTAQKPSYLVPGKGYAISAVPAKGETTTTIRISMDVDDDWFAGGEQISLDTITRNQIAVTAHTGAAADKDLCNAGWNFVANPYLTNFAANNISGAGYINGQIVVNNGKFEHNEEKIPYVTIPNANMSWYEQRRVQDAILSPMYSFFVQIAEGGTMTFTTDGRQQAPAALRASSEQTNPSFEADIVIFNNQEQVADHTGLVINDRWTPAYEIGGDLEKMFGTANRTAIYTLSGNTRLAYNALSYNDALVAIPVGFRAQANGEYTIQLRNTEDIEDVESIELKDLYNNQTTNLLYNDYTFYSDATQEDSRFVVYLVPKKNTTTDISTITNGNTENRKIIFNNHLYIIHNGNIYNGTGQMVK